MKKELLGVHRNRTGGSSLGQPHGREGLIVSQGTGLRMGKLLDNEDSWYVLGGAGVDGWGQILKDPKCQVEEFGFDSRLGKGCQRVLKKSGRI